MADQETTATALEHLADKDELVAEYKSLRGEINNNSIITAQVFTVTITAAAALIGFGFQTKNWLIFLSPPIILLPSLYFISSQLESTIRIAAYIYAVIEPKSDFQWETLLLQTRTHGKKGEDRSKVNYVNSLLGVYLLLIVICLGLAAAFLGDYRLFTADPISPLMLLIGSSAFIVLTTLRTLLLVRYSFSTRCFSDHVDGFRKALAELRTQDGAQANAPADASRGTTAAR